MNGGEGASRRRGRWESRQWGGLRTSGRGGDGWAVVRVKRWICRTRRCGWCEEMKEVGKMERLY